MKTEQFPCNHANQGIHANYDQAITLFNLAIHTTWQLIKCERALNIILEKNIKDITGNLYEY